jgi:heterogeneous nuclear ribonucleoprotein F/H
MRGLPFRVTENDIAEWFSSVTDPIAINIRYNNQGRPAGEADVLFSTESEAKKAMAKDRQNMQHRYVELFYDGPVGAAATNTGAEAGGWGQGMSAGSSGEMSGAMGANNVMNVGSSTGMGMGGAGGMNSVGFSSQMSEAEGNDYGAY